MASPLLVRPLPLRLLAALLPLLLLGMASKATIQVRFFAEAKMQDTEKFARPIQFRNPPREGYIQRIPTIHEGQIKSIYPFQATDGTWGCAFILDNDGRINLEVASTERRGSYLVAFVSTKKGTHQVVELLVDKVIRDGIISIPNGLTELEIVGLTKAFKIAGQKKK